MQALFHPQVIEDVYLDAGNGTVWRFDPGQFVPSAPGRLSNFNRQKGIFEIFASKRFDQLRQVVEFTSDLTLVSDAQV